MLPVTRDEQTLYDATRRNLMLQGCTASYADRQAAQAVGKARRSAQFPCGHPRSEANSARVGVGQGMRCKLCRTTARVRRAQGLPPQRPAMRLVRPGEPKPQKRTPARQDPMADAPASKTGTGFLRDMTHHEVSSRLREMQANARDWGRDRHADELDHLARQALRLNINLGGPRKGAGRPRS